MLNDALRYLQLGFSVIPLKPESKEPLINWKEFQTRRASESEVREWFTKWPNVNIGIVTGGISNLVAVDLDGPEGIKSSAHLGLQSPLCSISGKGKHLWYRHPGVHVDNSVKEIAPGVDIRGDGGYVLVPPSIHPSGARYRFNRPLSALSVDLLPLFPMSLIVKDAPVSILDVKRKDPDWIAKALEEMTNGNIDETLFRVCSFFRNLGVSADVVQTLIQPHALRAGATEGHLEDKIRNVWGRYEPKRNEQFTQFNNRGLQSLVLHSPTNPDSLNEYQQRIMGESRDETLKTGYTTFDTLTKGLKKGEVLTVAARTGVGKTNWIIGPIRTFCEKGNKVLLFSTEMSFDQIWQRYISTLEDSSSFQQHSLFICDEFTPDIERIEEAIKNVQPDLFIFDHISHIGTDYHVISRFMSEIKRIARLYQIPVIITAQLNRHADYVEQGQRIEPRLSMIQGSDQIGQMSAQVLLLNEKRVNGDITEIEGIVVKNRHGDKGLVQFGLLKNPYRMEEI